MNEHVFYLSTLFAHHIRERLYAYLYMLVIIMGSLLAIGFTGTHTLAGDMALIYTLPFDRNYFRGSICIITRHTVFAIAYFGTK